MKVVFGLCRLVGEPTERGAASPSGSSPRFNSCRKSGYKSLLLKPLNAIRLPSVLECVNKDKAKVQFVKNKNKSGGAMQAGSGHERLRRIPVPDQGKQRAGQKAAQLQAGQSHVLPNRLKLDRTSTLDHQDNTPRRHTQTHSI